MTDQVAQALAEVQKREGRRLVARLIRITGDWALAEDCVQDALLRAWERWPRDGVPDQPGAWLATVAKNRALDRWRRSKVEAERLTLLETEWGHPSQPTEDGLALLFTCCHPALPLEGQVALTLRSVAGLTTADIARAFLVSEDTMTRRITRARTKIQLAGIPFRGPSESGGNERLAGVLGVLYLLFNQGNDAALFEVDRQTLATEAIRLGRHLVELLPREGEPRGVLALMLLTAARRPARFSDDGSLVSLEVQDRSRWDKDAVAEGLVLLDQALLAPLPGTYTLQAAIAGCHARAARAEDTDFATIAGLYARLDSLAPSPVIRLNLAVARGLAEGPAVGLALAEALSNEPALARYHLLPAVRADFLSRLGRHEEAALAYGQAEALAPSEAERRFLAAKRESHRTTC